MFGLGSLIGGALKIGGSIFGGIKASQAMKQVQKNLNQQMADNQSWYDRRYNEDATQRADAQRMLAMTNQAIKDRNKEATGAAAVMGGTEESLAATKAANANALADTAAQIAVAGANRKDQIENQYLAKKDALNREWRGDKKGTAQSITNAIKGVTDTASDIAGGFDDASASGNGIKAGTISSSVGAGQALKNASNVGGTLVLGEDGRYHLVN